MPLVASLYTYRLHRPSVPHTHPIYGRIHSKKRISPLGHSHHNSQDFSGTLLPAFSWLQPYPAYEAARYDAWHRSRDATGRPIIEQALKVKKEPLSDDERSVLSAVASEPESELSSLLSTPPSFSGSEEGKNVSFVATHDADPEFIEGSSQSNVARSDENHEFVEGSSCRLSVRDTENHGSVEDLRRKIESSERSAPHDSVHGDDDTGFLKASLGRIRSHDRSEQKLSETSLPGQSKRVPKVEPFPPDLSTPSRGVIKEYFRTMPNPNGSKFQKKRSALITFPARLVPCYWKGCKDNLNDDVDDVKRHWQKVHKDPSKSSCCWLGCATFGTQYREGLWKHVEPHYGVNYRCTMCSRQFASRNSFTNHIQRCCHDVMEDAVRDIVKDESEGSEPESEEVD
ncbi:hypothetical protein C8Q75DRAFT_803658 [Abortiporus biennis]|nr:hypothetical protein C8Q75DRAFT_803658 [Abortiporus biennis]